MYVNDNFLKEYWRFVYVLCMFILIFMKGGSGDGSLGKYR